MARPSWAAMCIWVRRHERWPLTASLLCDTKKRVPRCKCRLLNVNGPATVVHVDGFEGVFYKVQALHAYPWGFGKEATFTYVYAIAQDQPQPVYYPVIYPRLFLVSIASDTKSADLFTVTIPTAQSAAPALQLLATGLLSMSTRSPCSSSRTRTWCTAVRAATPSARRSFKQR